MEADMVDDTPNEWGIRRSQNPHISDEDWNRPIYFPTFNEPPMRVPASSPVYPLYGLIGSLCLGKRAGWVVNGVQYPRDAFEEHGFEGAFTGGRPIGLVPKITLP
jgi:hypothetical protein